MHHQVQENPRLLNGKHIYKQNLNSGVILFKYYLLITFNCNII